MAIGWVYATPSREVGGTSLPEADTCGEFSSSVISSGGFYNLRSDLLSNPPQGLMAPIQDSIFVARVCVETEFPFPEVTTRFGNPPRSQLGLHTTMDNNMVTGRVFQDAFNQFLGYYQLVPHTQYLPYGKNARIPPEATAGQFIGAGEAMWLGFSFPTLTQIGWSGAGSVRYTGVIIHYPLRLFDALPSFWSAPQVRI